MNSYCMVSERYPIFNFQKRCAVNPINAEARGQTPQNETSYLNGSITILFIPLNCVGTKTVECIMNYNNFSIIIESYPFVHFTLL